ncbi:MAG: protein translocase subunit SecF [Mycobacteriales bacterium]
MREALRRLYNSETDFGFVRHRKWWYTMSAVAMIVCALSVGLRGFNLGVDFKGGNLLTMPTGNASLSHVQDAVSKSGVSVEQVQKVGSGSTGQFKVTTRVLPENEVSTLKSVLVKNLSGEITVKGHPVSAKDISQNQVSASWGRDVTKKAIVALIVFIIAVSAFISVLFEWRLALGAIIGVLHDLVLAAGIYSIVGFEVTPSTVVGLLTILGYSLYDNIVVYDKIRENVRGLLGVARETYSEAANRAVNETLARSINTSLISVLPVAGLLFVGVGLLGIGTIKDLALVLFVGLISGAYSSLFLAVPIGCELKERQPEYTALRQKLAQRRKARAASAERQVETSRAVPAGADGPDDGGRIGVEPAAAVDAPVVPRPGARPQRPNQRRRKPQPRRRR